MSPVGRRVSDLPANRMPAAREGGGHDRNTPLIFLKSDRMKYFLTILACLLVGGAGQAQDMPADVDMGRKNPYPFIGTQLLDLSEKAAKDLPAAVEMAQQRNMLVKDGSVYVEFVRGSQTDTHLPIDNEALRRLPDVEVTTTFVNRTSAWVRLDRLLETARALPPDHQMEAAILPIGDNQGPGIMNSDSYSTAGTGMLVAIIDSGFDSLTEARAAGTAPTAANTTAYDYPGGGIQTVTQHGTGCLETVFDHVPNAQYNIYKVATTSDLGTAVNQCIANGVDVISHSVSWYNLGWADDSGAACTAANNASNNGILFFNSAGNRHGQHWEGAFNNSDSDNWHNWVGTSDEQNAFTLGGGRSVNIRMQWNSASSNDHYDLYLYTTSTTLVASSTNTNNFESISYTNTGASTQNLFLAVFKNTTSPPTFEVFIYGSPSNLEYFTDSGSTTSPSNALGSNVISVGAVPRTSYEDPAGTAGIEASYSSRGPTNSGNQAPDLCAPTNTSTVAYAGAFGGTSCATPNAAGTAAAFWSGHPALNATGVRRILFAKADLYKDWGTSGIDNIFGRGGVYLHDYHSLNRYVLKSAGNTTSLSTLPYYSIGDIDSDGTVPSDLRIFYLDTYDTAPGTSVLIDKPMLYKSVPGTLID